MEPCSPRWLGSGQPLGGYPQRQILGASERSVRIAPEGDLFKVRNGPTVAYFTDYIAVKRNKKAFCSLLPRPRV